MRNKNLLHELQDPTNCNILTKRRFSGTSCFRGYGRRDGERRRKSVRGCIVSPDLSVLNLVIVKQGMFHCSVPCHSLWSLWFPICKVRLYYWLCPPIQQ
jgi:hypothetical protein